jgi:hypothetical protein
MKSSIMFCIVSAMAQIALPGVGLPGAYTGIVLEPATINTQAQIPPTDNTAQAPAQPPPAAPAPGPVVAEDIPVAEQPLPGQTGEDVPVAEQPLPGEATVATPAEPTIPPVPPVEVTTSEAVVVTTNAPAATTVAADTGVEVTTNQPATQPPAKPTAQATVAQNPATTQNPAATVVRKATSAAAPQATGTVNKPKCRKKGYTAGVPPPVGQQNGQTGQRQQPTRVTTTSRQAAQQTGGQVNRAPARTTTRAPAQQTATPPATGQRQQEPPQTPQQSTIAPVPTFVEQRSPR